MNIALAQKQIQELVNDHLVGWSFEFDYAQKRFGACYHGRKLITISKPLVELNEWDEVRDTALHEIAHALAGEKAHHNYLWKYWCRQIGARPERCYSKEKVVQPKMKYIAICPNCGYKWQRCVKPRKGAIYWCSKCSKGVYRKGSELHFKLNK